jgi:hypothetical protein
MLTIELAQRLRERGLLLPVKDGQQYETSQLAYIAARQQQLIQELNELDRELFEEKSSRVDL